MKDCNCGEMWPALVREAKAIAKVGAADPSFCRAGENNFVGDALGAKFGQVGSEVTSNRNRDGATAASMKLEEKKKRRSRAKTYPAIPASELLLASCWFQRAATP